MDGIFPKGSLIRRVDSEAALLLGGGRALLLQLAHPGVAAGVYEHSDFAGDPWRRLTGTLNAMYTIVFGSTEQAEQTAAALDRVHDRVTGAGYAANDPALKLWVHATLVDTAIRIHRRFLTPLRPDEEATYYDESMVLAELLGIPRSAQPATYDEFRAYVREMVRTLEVSDHARNVAGAVLHPKLPLLAEPLAGLARQISVGLCPEPLRTQYGLRWDPARELALQAAGLASRQTLGRLPAPLRRVPISTWAA
jgi:uncharacterized protein (DUF2236 family)